MIDQTKEYFGRLNVGAMVVVLSATGVLMACNDDSGGGGGGGDAGPQCECSAVTACCDGCAAINEGGSCIDGNACNVGETCQSGVCTGGTTVDCSGTADPCRNDDACDPVGAEGNCDVLSALNEGGACDDGDVCNVGETCQSGFCSGGSAADCSGTAGPCRDNDSCDPFGSEGNCDTLNPINESATCDDSDVCNIGETCQAGACAGGGAVDCSNTAGACSNDYACDSFGTEGNCDTLDPINEGFSCDVCRTGETCQTGVCSGGTVVDCTGTGDGVCSNDHICDPTGTESNCDLLDPINEGGTCDDGNACDVGETCQSGMCTGGTAVDCGDPTFCWGRPSCYRWGSEGNCDNASGALNENQPCDICNPGATCKSGACTGGSPGNDGQACDVCRTGETCQSGVCAGGAAVDCSGTADECSNNDFACDPTAAEGNCDVPDASPLHATPCQGSPCVLNESCSFGFCIQGTPVDCSDSADDCNLADSCDTNGPEGNCDIDNGWTNEGGACNSFSCKAGEICTDGVCAGGSLPAPVYVDSGVTTSGSGATWAEAKKTIQEGADAAAAGGRVFVAEGSYGPPGAGVSLLDMPEGVCLYGGFSGSETDPLDRPALHRGVTSTLEGGDSSVILGNSHTVLDRFTVANAFNDTTALGGGMFNRDVSHLTISDVTFSNNQVSSSAGSARGGGMYNMNVADLWLSGVMFLGNQARANDYAEGGGLYAESSKLTLSDVSFFGNGAHAYSYAYGGAMKVFASSLTLTDVKFVGNTASVTGSYYAYAGGGGAAFRRSSATLTDVTFAGNVATGSYRLGGGIEFYSSRMTVSHSSFYNNSPSAISVFAYPPYVDTLVNSVFYGNNGNDIEFERFGSQTYVCSEDTLNGVGNQTLTSDPFIQAASGELFLDQGSLGIDSANNRSAHDAYGTDGWRTLSSDIDGGVENTFADMGVHYDPSDAWIKTFVADAVSVAWTTNAPAGGGCTVAGGATDYDVPTADRANGSTAHGAVAAWSSPCAAPTQPAR